MPSLRMGIEVQSGRISADGVDWPQTWLVIGAASEAEAISYAMTHGPKYFGGAALAELEIATREGTGVYKLRAKYSMKRRTPINDEESEFGQADAEEIEYDLSGETVHITTALETTRYPETAPDNGRLIGVGPDGVKGCDVESNTETFVITRKFPRIFLTDELRAKWRAMRGKVNHAEWRTFPRGEVRFLSVSFRISGNDNLWIPVRFTFAIKPNQEDVDIDPDGPFNLDPIDSVGGWDVLDVVYKPHVNVHKEMRQRAWAAYKHRVFGWADFGELGLDPEDPPEDDEDDDPPEEEG